MRIDVRAVKEDLILNGNSMQFAGTHPEQREFLGFARYRFDVHGAFAARGFP